MTRNWILKVGLKMEQRFGASIGDRSLVYLMPSSSRAGWALVLAGIVFVGSGLLPGQGAIAQTQIPAPPLTQPSVGSVSDVWLTSGRGIALQCPYKTVTTCLEHHPVQPVLLADAVATTTAQPPAALVNTLRKDLSKRTGIASNKLQVVASSRQTWPDGCLGLATSGQMCTQAIVSGWRITFANGSRRWIYRTDATGRVYRLET